MKNNQPRKKNIGKGPRKESISKATRKDIISKATRKDIISKATRKDIIGKGTIKESINKGPIMEGIRKVWDFLLALFFPLHCPVCDEITAPFGSKICPACRLKLQPIRSSRCFKCGKVLWNNYEEYCQDCRSTRHSYIRGRSLYPYQSAAPGIYRFKYGGRCEYADFYGAEIAEHMKRFLTEIQPDALVPVPLHKKRQRSRGYNQSLLLAKAISRYTQIPVRSDLVRRVKNTAPMKRLTPVQRQNNLKKAFHMKENEVELSTVVIIDDIYTTGSTIDAVSTCLLEHGVKKVYFIALSCGEGV
jgi:ComF family protein